MRQGIGLIPEVSQCGRPFTRWQSLEAKEVSKNIDWVKARAFFTIFLVSEKVDANSTGPRAEKIRDCDSPRDL
ncbi:MAG: hypothetical protein CL917_06075 [Deltaproteobacteria bacterium]|nr:hypothetical protein [Deltaproteobacteria bacterium]